MKYFKMQALTKPPLARLCSLSVVDGDKSTQIGYTIEKPWKSNKPFISCVPPGWYDLEEFDSPSRGKVPILSNIELGVLPEGPSVRTYCEVHIANFPDEVEGCIGPGLGIHPTKLGVTDSEKAFDVVMQNFKAGVRRLLIE